MKNMNGTTKAWLFCGVFALLGTWDIFFRAPHTAEPLPHVIFYTVLLINTFFSLRFFAPVQPNNVSQTIIDLVCVAAYIALALSLGFAVLFGLAALAIFIASPTKYALMLEHIPHTAMLRRKILINLLGTTSCALLLATTFLGYPLEAAWTFAIAFALANIYLLAINPMYRL